MTLFDFKNITKEINSLDGIKVEQGIDWLTDKTEAWCQDAGCDVENQYKIWAVR